MYIYVYIFPSDAHYCSFFHSCVDFQYGLRFSKLMASGTMVPHRSSNGSWGNGPISRRHKERWFIIGNHQTNTCKLCGFLYFGEAQNGWFRMENPIEMDDN